jgi:hypothetical protein
MHPESKPLQCASTAHLQATPPTHKLSAAIWGGGSLTRPHLPRPHTKASANQQKQRQIRREGRVPAPRRRQQEAPRRSGTGLGALRCSAAANGGGTEAAGQATTAGQRADDDAAAVGGVAREGAKGLERLGSRWPLLY